MKKKTVTHYIVQFGFRGRCRWIDLRIPHKNIKTGSRALDEACWDYRNQPQMKHRLIKRTVTTVEEVV